MTASSNLPTLLMIGGGLLSSAGGGLRLLARPRPTPVPAPGGGTTDAVAILVAAGLIAPCARADGTSGYRAIGDPSRFDELLGRLPYGFGRSTEEPSR